LIGKVIDHAPSILHVACTFADFILHIYVALTAKLEAANKALAEERASQQVTDQALRASSSPTML
jgi:hypothetical protein